MQVWHPTLIHKVLEESL